MSKRLISPSSDELRLLYTPFGATISTLATHYHTSNPTVRKWLQNSNIPLKSHQRASAEANARHRLTTRPTLRDLTALYEMKSLKELEAYFHVGQETIYQWLHEFAIPIKSASDACLHANQREFEARLPTRLILEDAYRACSYNCRLLCDHFQISPGLLRRWMIHHQIATIIPWRSRQEETLFQYCQSLAPDHEWGANDRRLIAPFELDIVNHTKKLAIDYAGLYWHGARSGKSSDYHAEKRKKTNLAGYELITIFETDPAHLVESLLAYKLRAVTQIRKYHARQCLVERLSASDAAEFHRTHHLSGPCGATIHLGCRSTQTNELVQVMSCGRSRYSSTSTWEIVRLTNKSMTVVVGGASKLFAEFCRLVHPETVTTYADLRFGTGSVYPHLGFSYHHTSAPNYFYFHPKHKGLHSRIQFQKHKLADKLQIFDPSQTEWENMQVNVWDRIYDCGNAVYTWAATK